MPKKRGKRPDGDAKITRNVKRNRWEAKLTIGRGDDGRLVRKLYTGRTQKDVADKIDDARKELNAGVNLVTASSSVKEYLDQWLTEVLPGIVSAGTLKNYSEVARLVPEEHIQQRRVIGTIRQAARAQRIGQLRQHWDGHYV